MVTNTFHSSDNAYDSATRASSVRGAAAASENGHVILIVDDEAALGTSLERMLRFTGLQATAITSGSDALAFIQIRRPSLIVLDLNMPGLDGMTLLRAIRADAAFKNVPIVVYTADFSHEMERKAYAAGAQAYLIKGTIGWDTLLARFEELLGASAPRLRQSR